MSGRRIVSIMLVCSVASGVSITLSTTIARADDCLVAPGVTTPGRHWSYLTDRATQKKCWHLSGASQDFEKAGLRDGVPNVSTANGWFARTPGKSWKWILGGGLSDIVRAVSGMEAPYRPIDFAHV